MEGDIGVYLDGKSFDQVGLELPVLYLRHGNIVDDHVPGNWRADFADGSLAANLDVDGDEPRSGKIMDGRPSGHGIGLRAWLQRAFRNRVKPQARGEVGVARDREE